MTKSIEELDEYILSTYRYNPANGHVYLKKNTAKKSEKKVGSNSKKNDYSRIVIKGTYKLLHRVAWFLYYGKWPNGFIDHINGIKYDNRIENMREATRRQNCLNQKRHRDGDLVGAHYDKHKYKKKWVSRMRINGKSKYLGSYKTKEEAHKRYIEQLKSIGELTTDVYITKADQMLKEMNIK